MRVLVACEFSGIVRQAFREAGYDAVSCDLEASEQEGPHIIGDVRDYLNDGWDLMIAHPPCRFLCAAGSRHNFNGNLVDEALELVETLLNAPIPHIALENPPGIISTWIRKPNQYVHPWWFGDPVQKRTGLWLKNLPLLEKQNPALFFSTRVIHYQSPSEDRSRDRSRFYRGFANAMACQWGSYINANGFCGRQTLSA